MPNLSWPAYMYMLYFNYIPGSIFIFLCSFLCKYVTREDKGVRELISHIGPIPILIPLRLSLVTKLEFQNVISFEWINIFH